MAHKKAAGSAKNLRDSKPKYRGVKIFGWQVVKQWSIIVRQKGDKYKLWPNAYKGKDFTIHAATDGIVVFSKKKVARYDGRIYLKTYVDVQSPSIEKKKEVKKKSTTESVVLDTPKKETKTVTKKSTTTKRKEQEEKAEPTKVVKKTPVKKTSTTKAPSTKKKAA